MNTTLLPAGMHESLCQHELPLAFVGGSLAANPGIASQKLQQLRGQADEM